MRLPAQTILSWDFSTENTVATSTAEVHDASLDSSIVLTRGAGAAASAGANSFRTAGFKNDGIATANTDYFQFELSADSTHTLSLSTIDYKYAGTATYAGAAGASMQFAYSLDATNFVLIGNPFVTAASASTGTGTQISLTGISALQSLAGATTVTFRFYATGATTTGGWGFTSPSAGAGLAVGGTLVASGGSNVSIGGTSTFGAASFGGSAFTSADTAVFDGSAATVNLSGAVSTAGLKFTSTGYLLSSPTGADSVAVAGAIDVASGTTATISGKITGSNSVSKANTGTLVLSGANDFVGNVSIASGTLSISSDANLGNTANDVALVGTLATTSTISLNAGRDFSGSGTLDIANGTTLTTNGAFAVGALALANSGTLALAGPTNTLTGLTFNSAGAISGSAITSSGDITTSAFGGTATVSNNLALGSTARTYTTASNGALTLSGNLTSTGSGRIQKRGIGTLTLSGDNSGLIGVQLGSQGTTPLEGGTLVAESNTALGLGTNQFQFNSGTLTSTSARVFANGISVGGRTSSVSIPTLSGSNMEFQGTTSFFKATGTTGTLNLNVNNNTTLSGNFAASSGTGTSTGITLGGSGTLILTGSNSLLADNLTFGDTLTVNVNGATTGLGTGSVTVNSGATLKVNGAILANVISVGGTLAGNNGTISGTVTITSGGILAPGNSPGLITNSGSLIFNSSSIYAWELAAFTTSSPGTNFDQIINSGTVSFGSGAQLSPYFTGASTNPNSGDPFWTSNHSWVVISNAGGTMTGTGFDVSNTSWSGIGSFSTTVVGDAVTLTWTATTAVPEPSTYATILGVVVLTAAVYRRRQRASSR